VAEEIRHLLAECFLRGEVRDPELAGVVLTVTRVQVSPDLHYATAYVSWLGRADVAAKLPALQRAAPYLRGQLAHRLRLRLVPELAFAADTGLEAAARIEALLHSPAVRRDLDPPQG
jgi:ribosome-binding factor A